MEEAAKRAGVTLDKAQWRAVEMALSNRVSIITGDPGTGKTMIQRILLDVFTKNYPRPEPLCCALTGRAARRLEQTSGHNAVTIHKALGLHGNEDEKEPNILDQELILIDEISMLDIYLAAQLFGAVRTGASVVLIGDSDQLPSVGPGAVLSELIASGVIPVTKLEKVYRQEEGGAIAFNAAEIRNGHATLEYSDAFRMIEATAETAPELLESLYVSAVAQYGIDNVILLSPFRTKTETGVNALNLRIRDKVNAPHRDKRELTYHE